MLKLLAAAYVGYYIGRRSLPQAVEDVKKLTTQVEDLLTKINQLDVSQITG